MNTYIGLLRGINVSGKNILKMEELRELLANLGLDNVSTYLQSGNVIFQSKKQDRKGLAEMLERKLLSAMGYEVPFILLKPAELKRMLEENPFSGNSGVIEQSLYYVIWKDPPEKGFEQKLISRQFPYEDWAIGRKCIYLNCLKGYGRSKLNNNVMEGLGKMVATTRNHRTILELVKRSGIG